VSTAFAGNADIPEDTQYGRPAKIVARASPSTNFTAVMRRSIHLPAEQREYPCQNDADDDAGDDWKIEIKGSAFDPDVTWQTPKPPGGKPAPERKADQDCDDADQDEKFSYVVHSPKFRAPSTVCAAFPQDS
jgi:hypothetical protein